MIIKYGQQILIKKNFPKLPLTIVCVVHNIRILSNSESHLNRPNGERSRGKSFI